ncbi:MAG: universal stress protein [Chloroflexota bacterium]|nr:universal stress protein [Chloroflexota bacterium]
MHGTLLVLLDGSPPSEAVLPYAAVIAQATACSLELLSVVERRPRGLTSRSEQHADELEHAAEQALRASLAGTADALVRLGIDARTTIVRGEPVDVILELAEPEQVRMIALTAHGRTGMDRIERWSIGGVADKVMRLSPKPTLIVPVPYVRVGPQPPPREVRLERLMVPLDGSPLAEEALPLAVDLASATGARLTLVRVESWVTEGSAPYGSVPEFTELEDEAAAEAQEYLAQVAGRLGPAPAVDMVVLRGRPAEALVDFSLHERTDLVVMTTHGRGGLRRLVLGSVADRVVRAGVPALLSRPKEQTAP